MSQAAATEKKYTYGNYLGWPEGERWELIEGVFVQSDASTVDCVINSL